MPTKSLASGSMGKGSRTFTDENIGRTKPYRAYYASFDDFVITTISDETPENLFYWQIHLDFRPTQVGGCQQKVTAGDQVLFAIASNATTARLKLAGPQNAVVRFPLEVRVTNETGNPIKGATVKGQRTNAQGIASVFFNKDETGLQKLKATMVNTVRSNVLEIFVIASISYPYPDTRYE
jgi:hypothetical protein